MLRIAAFADLAGISAKVLRDYDEAGLFRPAWVDRQTGYRLYSPAQLPELRRILALRDLGVGLAEIRALLTDGADLAVVLERRRVALEAARRDTERRLAALGISLAAAVGGAGPDIVVRDIAPELVATLDVAQAGGDDHRAFYELELAVRDAGVRAARPPGELLRAGSSPAEAPLAEVFVPVRRAAAGLNVRRLPAVRAATILHRGPYKTIEHAWQALERWIEGARLEPAEPVRVIYLQFGAEAELRLPRPYLVSRPGDLLTELQVPVG